jgi:hypothetical protein
MSFDLNPLDILDKRKVDFMPIHFVKTKINLPDLIDESIIDWIETKLNGRFAVSVEPTIDSNGKLVTATFIGFENQKELTYFLLACPYLRRN